MLNELITQYVESLEQEEDNNDDKVAHITPPTSLKAQQAVELLLQYQEF